MDSKNEARLKKAARRLKQRTENISRAQAMRAAKKAFDPPKATPHFDLPQRNIGCSGWFYWHWRDVFYKNKPTKDWFNHYAKHFKTVELIYTVKVSELITHIKRFVGTKRLIQDFDFIAELLGAKMGCFLYQLPPSFTYTPARLKNILQQLTPNRRNVVEFRHQSWWNETVYQAFRETNTIFCSCSGPKLPDTLIKTSDEIYIRFHGTSKWYRHNYSKQDLLLWADRITTSCAKRIWVYFNNDNDGYAIKNAKALLKIFKAK
jgi:uncharacterized protein YecE (DUF72 family)